MTDLFDHASAPATEPSGFVAGDLVMWRRTDDLTRQYAVAGYTLTYAIRPAAGGATVVTATGTVSGGEWRISLAATVTAAMASGRWYWSAYITRTADGARVQVDDGEFLVEANRTVSPEDTRSHAVKVLDAIEASIEGRAGDTVQSYTIGGRQINKMGADELIKWRNYYRAEVQAEIDAARLENGLPAQNTIQVRFTG